MKTITILFFALATAGFTSCNRKSNSDVIRIGILEGPSAVSFVKMIDQKHVIGGKKVEFIIRSEPFQIQAMMLRNELDFAVLPTVMAANLFNKGVRYRLIAVPVWGTLYFLSNSDDIRTLYDFRDEKIAVMGRNSTADVLTRHIMRNRQIEYRGLDYRFATNHEVAQALLAGKVRVAVVSEPLVSTLLAKDSTIHIVEKLNLSGYFDGVQKNYFLQTAFLVSDHFIQHYSHLIPQVSRAYVESSNFVSENPEAVAQLMVKHNIMPDVELAAKSIELCNINFVAAFALIRELHHFLQVFYMENPESIGGKMPASDFVFHIYSASR